jgi:DNA-binding transcriptional ArsR family regulator
MVNNTANLNLIFGSLADPTRRDILSRLKQQAMSVSQIAAQYDVSLPAVSRHLRVLQRADLITKQRRGKEQIVAISPYTLQQADEYISYYRNYWQLQLDSLEAYVTEE